MTGLFGLFSDDGWFFTFPGAPFVLSGLLMIIAIRIMWSFGLSVKI
jgi:hypothetical protein